MIGLLKVLESLSLSIFPTLVLQCQLAMSMSVAFFYKTFVNNYHIRVYSRPSPIMPSCFPADPSPAGYSSSPRRPQ